MSPQRERGFDVEAFVVAVEGVSFTRNRTTLRLAEVNRSINRLRPIKKALSQSIVSSGLLLPVFTDTKERW